MWVWFLGLGDSPGWRHVYPLQYSCLEHPMDRGAWQAIVHRIARSQTQLKWLSTHTYASRDRTEVKITVVSRLLSSILKSPKSFRKEWFLGLISIDCDFILLECDLGFEIFERSSGDSNVQTSLGTDGKLCGNQTILENLHWGGKLTDVMKVL